MLVRVFLVFCIFSSTANAQIATPLRFKNNGALLPLEYTANCDGTTVVCTNDAANHWINITAVAAGTSFPLFAPDGSAGAPQYTFASDHTMGLFRIGANGLGLTVNGSDFLTFSIGGIDRIGSTLRIGTAGTPQINLGDANTSLEIDAVILGDTLWTINNNHRIGTETSDNLTQPGGTGGNFTASAANGGEGHHDGFPDVAGGPGGGVFTLAGIGGGGTAALAAGKGGDAHLQSGGGGQDNGGGGAASGDVYVETGASSGIVANGVIHVGDANANSVLLGRSGHNVTIGGYVVINTLYSSPVAPTISSGFGMGASVSANNGTSTFRVSVGTTTGNTGVIGLPTASTNWNCHCEDTTTVSATVFQTVQTSTSSSSCTVGNFSAAAAAHAWADNDVLTCFAGAE